jgi:hypothetical protein
MLTKVREAEIRAAALGDNEQPIVLIGFARIVAQDLLAELDETRERVARLREFAIKVRDRGAGPIMHRLEARAVIEADDLAAANKEQP